MINMANIKVLSPKINMALPQHHKGNSASSNKYIVYDVDTFKKKMNPKNKCQSKSRKKVINVCHKEIENFKLKFHPERFNNQENKPDFKKSSLQIKAKSNNNNASTVFVSKGKNRKGTSGAAKYLCDVCCATFKISTNLKEHLKIHSSVKEHRCPKCNYSCHRERNLRIHILTHEVKKPIQCPLCEYTCIQKFQLKAHLLLHQTDMPFKCNLCETKYKTEAGLKVHMLTHSNQYKFKCQDCTYVTNRYADHRRHLLIHSKSKPEQCPYCKYSCIRKSRLTAHMLVHRGENSLGNEDSILTKIGTKLVNCQQCAYVCTTASRMKKHMKSHTVKHKELTSALEKTLMPQDSCENQQGNSLSNDEGQSVTESAVTLPPDTIILDQNSINQVSIFDADLKQEILIVPPVTHQIIFTQTPNETEIFSTENNSLFIPTENSTVLLTSAVVSQESNGIIPNTSWASDRFWLNTDSFSMDQLGTLTFDQIVQPTGNFIVTVVKEEPTGEAIRAEEPEMQVERNHSLSKMYHCTFCSFSCDYKSTYKKHLRKHEKMKNYKCAHCHYMCDELSRMKKHLMSHTDQKVFQCESCQFSCKSKSTFQQHVLAHAKGEKSGGCFQCPHCDYSCKSMPGLKSHLAKHTGDNAYQCDLCEEKFMTEYLLKKHKFTHGVRPHQCQFCNYSCVQKQQMSIHMLQHTYEYPFCCQLCNAKYKKQDSLKIHMMSQHENKHRFNCQLCNYAGNRAADFREHMMTHSSQKPHQCPHCSYSCIRHTKLIKHMAIHDKDRSSNTKMKQVTSNKKMYQCAFCDFTCTRTLRLQAHLAKLHLPENIIFSFDPTVSQTSFLQPQT